MRRATSFVVLLFAVLAVRPAWADSCAGSDAYRLGAGIYDITGPPAEIGMMGYAMPYQRTQGIHTRLWSRAFVIESPCNGKRVAFISADLGLVTQAMKQEVVRKLGAKFGEVYEDANVLISATHTHSGPGGYSHYTMYNLTVLGFSPQNLRVVVDGIYESIVRAHENLVDGKMTIASGELLETSINRSRTAYDQNPESERSQYPHDTDKLMTVVKLADQSGGEIGMIDWFAVHATSMGNTHRFISGDNKGYASYLFERHKKSDHGAKRTFVAAFAQSNEGDTSPNVLGGDNGGGEDDFASTELSGEKQFRKALGLYEEAKKPLKGPVDFRHVHVKMDEVRISPDLTDGQPRETCPAAIGLSMLAGAEDGRGIGREGLACNASTPEWLEPICAATTTTCQGEKPISLEMGTRKPYPWTPEVLPIQIVRIGQLALVALPYELTTMAGRRLRETVAAELQPAGIEQVIIAGLANAYAGYVVTREEYSIQHYEGASTHFGPWTLAALQQETRKLAAALREGKTVDPGPAPRDLSMVQKTLLDEVLFDAVPEGRQFGEIVVDAEQSYSPGQNVQVTFWSGNPNNDLKTQKSYLYVEQKTDEGWRNVATDRDWETKFAWERNYCLPSTQCSQATVQWEVPAAAAPGLYRIRHDGYWKSKEDQSVHPYSGMSREFEIR